jgi:hypothetical protein
MVGYDLSANLVNAIKSLHASAKLTKLRGP